MNLFKPVFKLMWHNTSVNDEKRIKSQIKPIGLEEIIDIPYIDDNNKYHLLDVYFPENTNTKLPLIIDVHGGGWMYGTKEINKYYCLEVAKRGFCVISLNYRLAMDDDIYVGEQLSDLFYAYKWIGENMQKYPIDTNNVFLTGDSAGGQFVCLSAALNSNPSLRNEYSLPDNSLDFKCIGATSPVIDLLSPNIAMNVNLTSIIGFPHKSSTYYKLMDFKNVASSSLPPFYIVTSSGDFVEKQGRKLHNILNSLNVENEFHDWNEKINGKRLGHVFSVSNPFSGQGIRTINEMTQFFKRHME